MNKYFSDENGLTQFNHMELYFPFILIDIGKGQKITASYVVYTNKNNNAKKDPYEFNTTLSNKNIRQRNKNHNLFLPFQLKTSPGFN